MEIICKKEDCTGCMACLNICPKAAITARADEEGFLRPHIDQDLCIDCGQCVAVCPANHLPELREPLEALSGWTRDEAVRMASSSGGAFSAIAQAVIRKGGVVFGAAFTADCEVEHIGVETVSDLARLRGSKYVQSRMGHAYRQVRHQLASGRLVLFSGTPCQVAGLRNFLRKQPTGRLITLEVACHGIPSPRVFDLWKRWLARRKGFAAISSVNFRSKARSWIFYNMDVEGRRTDGSPSRYLGRYHSDTWIRGFLSDNFLRPSCHTCPFAAPRRGADITLADWWDYAPAPGEPADFEQRGVSLILCNTPEAQQFISEKVEPAMQLRRQPVEAALSTSQPFSKPFPAPASRQEFWQVLDSEGFDAAVKRFMRPVRPRVNERILMAMRPSPRRQLVLNVYYKVRDLGRLLRAPRPLSALAEKIRRRLKWRTECRFMRVYSAKVARSIAESRGRKSVYLFCAPIHPNLGDQAQTVCILRLLREHYPDHQPVWIPYQLFAPDTLDQVAAAIGPGDVVMVHSGYLASELYGYLPVICDIAEKFRSNPVVILPQTLNILTDEMRARAVAVFNAHPDLTLMCRDEFSFEKAKQLFTCHLRLFPDVVTSLIGLEEFDFGNPRDGVLLVVRNDKEKLYSDDDIARLRQRLESQGIKVDMADTTIDVSPFAWPRRRQEIIRRHLQMLSRYRLVITDRYHGTIFSQVVSTPTIVISSSDHKLSSGVRWFPAEHFGERLFFAPDLDQTFRLATEVLSRPTPPPCRSDYFRTNFWQHFRN